jgi:hypothetical protein
MGHAADISGWKKNADMTITRKNSPAFQWLGVIPAFELAARAFCVAAGLALSSSTTYAQTVYMMQFNQANNSFGTFDLSSGVFTPDGSVGSTLFNDIAGASDGTLWGIVNATSLVSLNLNDGSILTTVNFSVSGIESLAFAPDGTLYGATQGALYTINRANGQATLVGNFNNSLLGSSGQNIRFGPDGNLYNTDGGVNANDTHLFRISTVDGTASTMGTIASFPGLVLENAGNMMYGVGIQLGSASTLVQNLVGIDLNSIPPGGGLTNISYSLVSPNFPNNFNFTSTNTYVVPGTPVPEPGVTAICVAGGAWLLHRRRDRARRF